MMCDIIRRTCTSKLMLNAWGAVLTVVMILEEHNLAMTTPACNLVTGCKGHTDCIKSGVDPAELTEPGEDS